MPSITKDIVYEAVWAPNAAAYRVEHYQQDLSGTTYTLTDQEQPQGNVGATVTATAKNYIGFHENTGHSGRRPSGQVLADGSLVLRLYYARNTLTATFDSNGGNAVPSQNGILYGGVAVEPIPPQKTGYSFIGWYDQALSTRYQFSTPMTVGVSLYAKWDARTDTAYRVEHHRQNVAGEGYTPFETENLTGSTDTTATAAVKTYPGFHENATHPGRVPTGQIAPDGSSLLRVYYDRETYTVMFDSRKGSSIPAQSGIRYEATTAEPSAPSRTAYDFGGWYADAGLTTPYVFTKPVKGDTTLYAKWDPRTDTAYRVEHYQQDVTGEGYTLIETDILEGTTDATATATAKSYTGFHETTTHPDRVPSGPIAPEGSLVLKVYYARNSYTVSFDANGGVLTANPISVVFGTPYGPLPAPTFKNHKFVGWYIAPSDTLPLNDNSPVMIPGDHTLLARWVEDGHGLVDGIVTDPDGNPVPGTKITIRAGNVDYMTTVTDANGAYAISDVAYGTYNLVAEKDGITVTIKLDIPAERISQNIVLPHGKTNSVVEVIGDAPEVVVGGLDMLFGAPEIYSAEDEVVVSSGGLVELKMTIEPKNAAELGEDKAKLERITQDPVSLYLSVRMEKTVQAVDAETSTSGLTELPQTVDLFLPFQVVSGCRVLRVHDGAAEEITETPNENGEYIELESGLIILHASRFSTYAVTTPPPPPTSGGSGWTKPDGNEKLRYTITARAGFGGAVTPEHTEAAAGERVSVAILPDAEHRVDTVTVDGARTERIEAYAFEAVDQDHTLEASFFCPSAQYEDLSPERWYHIPVDFVLNRKYMVGTAVDLFEPDAVLTRAQMVTLLARVAEAKLDPLAETEFRDVSGSAWYAGSVGWAWKQEVGLGYGNERFGPDDLLTREQLAAMLWRYAGYPEADTSAADLTAFPDGDNVSAWARDAMSWAVGIKLLEGDERGYLLPKGNATRAEAAAIIQRLVDTR